MSDPDATLTSYGMAEDFASAPVLGITVLWHPQRERIGEQMLGPAAGGAIALNRFAPLFARAGAGHEGTPLGERSITREPVHVRFVAEGGIQIDHVRGKMGLELNGRPSNGTDRFTASELERGIVIGLGSQIFVCLHLMRSLPRAANVPGLIGVGDGAIKMRDAIAQVAGTSMPVLLLGETGSGKEVAAQAIHTLSGRRNGRFVAINMATLSESLAAAELFGAVKGAYTGATSGRRGWFAEAEDGTLFLDEVGDTPASVQAMLLRVLESGEYRPLGAGADARSNARIVAATDQDLGEGGFNQALRRRLEAFVIRVPALRERREDIGVLVRHFLEAEAPGDGWSLPFELLSQVFNGDWPGNVRQLAHAMRRVALDLQAGNVPVLEQSVMMPVVEPAPVPAGAAASASVSRPVRRKVSELSDDDLLEAMEKSQWQILAASKALGISRPTVYKLLEAHPRIRFPANISEEEIRAAWEACEGDLQRCASRLMTPAEALRRHAGLLGLAQTIEDA
ncbi:sigma 54-interacting transcriptional regulator [Massilia sp. CFBP9012]|uniref:sigma 54-interacting transcriptional regulator n=1 Tax=Massilia sp. CFBP9012 TaxID=3096531 RepID=UPI002A69D748|nr:sigma 54-interacting transcriptional regulator [Massilia sp. CFBP9012]MDY0978366.1 sigma 54-interacting transcriptional regulator [Massilia sp. CFBP9012]